MCKLLEVLLSTWLIQEAIGGGSCCCPLTRASQHHVTYHYMSYHSSKELQTDQERKLLQRNFSLQNYCRSENRRSCFTTKKVHWFFSHVCNGKFAAFWVLCCGITCKWVLIPSMDVCFYWFAQISEIDNRLVTVRMIKTAKGVQCECFTLKKARLCPYLSISRRRFCLCALQPIGLSNVQND